MYECAYVAERLNLGDLRAGLFSLKPLANLLRAAHGPSLLSNPCQ